MPTVSATVTTSSGKSPASIFKARTEAMKRARSLVGEIFVAGERNQKLWRIHTSDESRRKIPWRDPGGIDTDDAKSIRGAIEAGVDDLVSGRAKSFRPALKLAVKLARNAIKSNFRKSLHFAGKTVGAPVAMKPLSPAYARRRRRGAALSRAFAKAGGGKLGAGFTGTGKAQKPLMLTGELFRSIRARVTDTGGRP